VSDSVDIVIARQRDNLAQAEARNRVAIIHMSPEDLHAMLTEIDRLRADVDSLEQEKQDAMYEHMGEDL
jgi:hypothetical protein